MLAAPIICTFFFFNDTTTTEIYTLSLHDALPILLQGFHEAFSLGVVVRIADAAHTGLDVMRSEEHTSELQSLRHLVCRLLLEKKKQRNEPCHLTSIHPPSK